MLEGSKNFHVETPHKEEADDTISKRSLSWSGHFGMARTPKKGNTPPDPESPSKRRRSKAPKKDGSLLRSLLENESAEDAEEKAKRVGMKGITEEDEDEEELLDRRSHSLGNQ